MPPGTTSRSAATVLSLSLLSLPTGALAQSGRASLNGWVAFEGVAYVETQPRATVELRRQGTDSGVAYSTSTDAHGCFSFAGIGLGEFLLRIQAPGFQDYSAAVYLASDFLGNWAVLLKTAAPPVHPDH